MRSPTSLLVCMLLAGASFASVAWAYPTEVETQLVKSVAPSLQARARLPLKVGHDPGKPSTCPASNNGPPAAWNYPEHTYTINQIKKAFLEGAKLAAAEKTVGNNNYPHDYGSNPPMPFDCGKSLMEFPIQLDGHAYDGGDIGGIPDRVLFEYSEGKEFLVKYCGVMRHGPPGGPAFLPCPET
ncbi:Ribonuclease/ribotoxin [Byssothecium circinans]|uniref:ribonuclease T1 n=1 Tax=Byssothecium circinans TaxID=147558 RepID=A0A6A5TFM1_9PLEO|nr:Ribonuclease/ribotoxin [Byssothecium circinans]